MTTDYVIKFQGKELLRTRVDDYEDRVKYFSLDKNVKPKEGDVFGKISDPKAFGLQDSELYDAWYYSDFGLDIKNDVEVKSSSFPDYTFMFETVSE